MIEIFSHSFNKKTIKIILIKNFKKLNKENIDKILNLL